MTFQKNDRYAGPLIGGRYQVMASAIGPTFYIYDDVSGGVVVEPLGGAIKRFEKILDAEEYIGVLCTSDAIRISDAEGKKRFVRLVSAKVYEGEIEMSKKLTDKEVAKAKAADDAREAKRLALIASKKPRGKVKAVKKADATVRAPKPSKKSPLADLTQAVFEVPKKPKTVRTKEKRSEEMTPEPPAPEAIPAESIPVVGSKGTKKSRKAAPTPISEAPTAKPAREPDVDHGGTRPKAPTRKGTIRGLIEELVLEARKTDFQIHETVQEEFPGKKILPISWYRAAMRRNGLNPPARIQESMK